MGNKPGYLVRRDQLIDEYITKAQLTMKQFMTDTLQIVINETEGFGYDRIVRLTEAWEKKQKELFPAITPRDPLCDVKQEHMQRAFKRICKGRQDVLPIADRYPYLKEVRYDKNRTKHR